MCARRSRAGAGNQEIAKVSWTRADRRDADKIYVELGRIRKKLPLFLFAGDCDPVNASRRGCNH